VFVPTQRPLRVASGNAQQPPPPVGGNGITGFAPGSLQTAPMEETFGNSSSNNNQSMPRSNNRGFTSVASQSNSFHVGQLQSMSHNLQSPALPFGGAAVPLLAQNPLASMQLQPQSPVDAALLASHYTSLSGPLMGLQLQNVFPPELLAGLSPGLVAAPDVSTLFQHLVLNSHFMSQMVVLLPMLVSALAASQHSQVFWLHARSLCCLGSAGEHPCATAALVSSLDVQSIGAGRGWVCRCRTV
jgi:hypothetical protein